MPRAGECCRSRVGHRGGCRSGLGRPPVLIVEITGEEQGGAVIAGSVWSTAANDA